MKTELLAFRHLQFHFLNDPSPFSETRFPGRSTKLRNSALLRSYHPLASLKSNMGNPKRTQQQDIPQEELPSYVLDCLGKGLVTPINPLHGA